MKTIISNFEEVTELVNQIMQFTPISLEAIICTIIDTESAKYKVPVVDILEHICDAVLSVNEELGAYQLDKKGEL